MSSMPGLPRLLVLTDRTQLRLGRGLLPTLAECRDAGLTHVVLRELDEPYEQRAALAIAAADLGLTVIAAHMPLPAATGVQLPSYGSWPPPARPTRARPAQARPEQARPPVLGRSCHGPEEVAAAARDGFDYVTLGPYAATASKPGHLPPPGGLDYAGHAIPVYALGGVTPANAAQALHDGAYGVAVMGEVMRAEEPGAVVAELIGVVAAGKKNFFPTGAAPLGERPTP